MFWVLFSVAFATEWQQPGEDVLEVLHAPKLPWVGNNGLIQDEPILPMAS